jgi:hypothetical protein
MTQDMMNKFNKWRSERDVALKRVKELESSGSRRSSATTRELSELRAEADGLRDQAATLLQERQQLAAMLGAGT